MTAFAHGNFRGKRLVIFGCGYVGGEVARQAVEAGLVVTALTRNEAKAIVLREAGVDVIVGDLAQADWHAQIPTAEFVLNCVSSGGGAVENYRRSYLEGMGPAVAWAARVGGVGTFVYTSSTSVYPGHDGARVDERAPTGGDERAQLLLAAERQLAEACGACRRWFVLRLAGIYGPQRHHLLTQVRTGEISGRGEHRLNLAHRDDIVAAIARCFAAPAPVANEVFNVADDEPAAKVHVAAWLAARIGASVPHFTGAPAKGRRAITPDRVISNAKLKSVLGWSPRYPTFREGYESLLSR